MDTRTLAPDWLAARARLSPERVGLVERATGRQTTFAAWHARARRTAALLHRLGVRAGDRVAVLAANRAEMLDLLFACGTLGAILHPLNGRLASPELQRVVAASQPRAFLHAAAFAETAAVLRAALPPGCVRLALDGSGDADVAFAERAREAVREDLGATATCDTPWLIVNTGGTTGLPKGAVLTHGNLLANASGTVASWGLRDDDVAPLQLPLYHVGGFNVFCLPLVWIGGTTVLCTGFDADETFDLLPSVTRYIGVPAMFAALQAHPRWPSADFSTLRLVISGGAPCPPAISRAFWDRGVLFRQGYGLTEATGNNFWLPDAEVRARPGSVGRPMLHVEARVVDPETGAACAPGQTGELLLRGPHVMAGYWQRPEATAEVLCDGWLRTGDLARTDAEGFYTIVGRRKEMFISGGENVYPSEVEAALLAHPGVAEAAVVGVPDARWGEVGHAFVVPTPAVALSAEALEAFLAERLARYKRPAALTFVAALPRTPLGKIDKNALAAVSAVSHSPSQPPLS
ncbi:MAG: acyl-CoA synthetase [Rubricoccaceae bacterium]